MSKGSNPATLLLKWRLIEGFDARVEEPATKPGKSRSKKLGTVVTMADTQKGKVEGKTDVVLMLITTNKQDEDDPPYALQVSLLDYSQLNSDLLSQVKKGLAADATPIQVARK